MSNHLDESALMSAQVILTVATTIGGEQVTSANVREVLPDDRAADAIRRVFSLLGFAVGPAFAGSFSIVGTVALFDSVFHSVADEFGVASCAELSGEEIELPVGDLADSLGDLLRDVAAVVMTAAPDFGPGNP